jgi:hypothetical protein
MGDLLSEDDALASTNILYRCLILLLDRKAALFSHLKSRWQDLFGNYKHEPRGIREPDPAIRRLPNSSPAHLF